LQKPKKSTGPFIGKLKFDMKNDVGSLNSNPSLCPAIFDCTYELNVSFINHVNNTAITLVNIFTATDIRHLTPHFHSGFVQKNLSAWLNSTIINNRKDNKTV